ncbi:MAG: histidine--tRNA ligase [Candidatus Woesearchaeota archaeon]|jgi:histidyl-tRNA synthetase
MKVETAKGVRDIPPEEKILKARIISTIQSIFEIYGFNPLDTPIIERYDVLSSKYAGGAEILKETFKLNDQGERNLCLRYDLTVPLARFIAMNPMLKMPFKRYQIGQVFRDGPIKLGRYREFTQCDVDVVGNKDVIAEAELLSIAKQVFENLNLPVTIKVNNRKVLNAIMTKANIPEDKKLDSILSLDKIEKIGAANVAKELIQLGLEEDMIETLFKLTDRLNNTLETINFLTLELGDEAMKEIIELFKYLNIMNVSAEFYPNLSRGLSYYTGTVFEVFANDSAVKSSITAGGRYDKMIGDFVGNNQEYPAVGISFGIDVIFEVLKLIESKPKKTVVKVFVISIKTDNESIKLAAELRLNDIPTDLNLKKGVSKGLEYAAHYEIPYVVFVGENELKEGKYKLRNMITGKEDLLDQETLINFLLEE